MNWTQTALWKESAYNTMWCLIGCSIGDLGVILGFQLYNPTYAEAHPMNVMALAMAAGIGTSIVLETIILSRTLPVKTALRTAVGMSLISMISMEAAMNAMDFALTGGAKLTWWVLPPMWLAGFITPWPYNYWRLAKHGQSCCGCSTATEPVTGDE